MSGNRDEANIAVARETIGSKTLLMVDAGHGDAFWQNGYNWALRTAQFMLKLAVQEIKIVAVCHLLSVF